MAYGWGASDVANLVRLAYEVYDHCRHAPEELRGLLDQVSRVHCKLEQFLVILERSGFEKWNGLLDLEQHLLAVREALRPLQSASHNLKFLVRLALKRRQLGRIAKSLDTSERELQSIKVDLILVCSLGNLQFISDLRRQRLNTELCPSLPQMGRNLLDRQQRACITSSQAPVHADESFSTRDPTLTDLRTVLQEAAALNSMSRSRSPRFEELARRDDNIHDIGAIEQFVMGVASFAEAAELYARDADHIENLESTPRATSEALSCRPSTARAAVDLAAEASGTHLCIQSPTSPRNNQLSVTPASSGSSPLGDRPVMMHVTSPEPRYREFDAIDQASDTSGRATIELQCYARVSVNGYPLISTGGRFDVEFVGDFVLLRFLCADTLDRLDRAADLIESLPPEHASSKNGSSFAVETRPCSVVTLQHRLETFARPIPCLMHPSVEGAAIEPNAPFTITFSRLQHVSTRATDGKFVQTDSLVYIFQDEQHRSKTCEQIFGKHLVTTVGSDKVCHGGQRQSYRCAISMWFDISTRSLSVTFPRNIDKKSDVEIEVHGLLSKKCAQDSSRVVELTAGPMRAPGQDSKNVRAPLRRMSSGADKAKCSETSDPARGSRWKKGRFKCEIHFSSTVDKVSFLACLRRYIPR